MTMAAKWEEARKLRWECKGTAECQEPLKEEDKALEQETAKMRLKILESRWNKLVNIAETMQSEVENKMGEELSELNEEVPYSNCVQIMALDKANEAANRRCYRIEGLRKKLEFMPIGSEAGSTTGGGFHKQKGYQTKYSFDSFKT